MKPKDQDGICNDVFTLKDDKFIEVEEDKRKPVDIIKRHFKFYFKSIMVQMMRKIIHIFY